MGEQALRRSLLHLAGSQNPVEVVDLADLEQTAQLLAAFTRKLGEEGAQV